MRLQRSLFKPRAHAGHRIEAKAKDEATVYLYDEISWLGIQAADFVKDLAAIDAPTIHLRINSPGGSVFDGIAIYNALKEHPARVIAHVDGLAASIAALIPMAADELHMAENAYLMIHEPWSMVIGGAQDLRDEAELLDKVSGTIRDTFAARSGADADQVAAWMAAETWFTAGEAVDAKLADLVDTNNGNEKAKATAFDLSAFAHVPDQLQGRAAPTERDMERALRDVGCSQQQAKAILAEGFKAKQRDAAEPEPVAAEPEPRDAAPAPIGKDKVTALLAQVDIYLATTRTEGVAA